MSKLSKITLKKTAIIGTVFFCVFIVFIVLRNWYNPKEANITHKKSLEVQHTTENKNKDSNPFTQFWKYHAGDNLEWALPTYNDNLWQSIEPELNLDSIPKELFNGIGWFRIRFSIDSLMINKLTAIYLHHYGASEIYLDGNLIIAFGKVSTDKENERSFIPDLPVVFSLGDTLKHILAIRYSNQFFQDNKEKYAEEIAGIRFSYLDRPYEYIVQRFRTEEIWFTFILLFGFFLTLSLTHFLLYVFYRKQKQNLYYSIFVFAFSIMTITPYILSHSHSASAYLKLQFYYIVPTILFLPSIVGCLHSLFKPSYAKRIFIIEIILVVAVLLSMFITSLLDYNGIILIILVIFTSIESIRSVLSGIINKKPGAKIIGTGVLIFFLSILIFIVVASITSNFNLSIGNSSSIFYIAIVILSIISIPLSMSIYLARDFALTNKNLQNKLEEVESLSTKTIAQEKEKQQILSSQKETLEIQVIERTAEVVKQKEIIEEKNKDITDSINYAKRIQQAKLPKKEEIYSALPQSFVLFKPKDIVSGDFYFFYKTKKNVFIVAADCTGHGVPGAFMSMIGSEKLEDAVSQTTDTSEILNLLNKGIKTALKQSENDESTRDGMDIAICSIDTENRIVKYAGANRPLWIIRHKNVAVEEIKPTKVAIGGLTNESQYFDTHELKLQQGDTFYIFSDGYADTFSGQGNKKLTTKKFKEILLSIQDKSMREQEQYLNNFLENWKAGIEQIDDILVIGVRL